LTPFLPLVAKAFLDLNVVPLGPRQFHKSLFEKPVIIQEHEQIFFDVLEGNAFWKWEIMIQLWYVIYYIPLHRPNAGT